MVRDTERVPREGFFIPGQVGLIIEAVILLVFLGLFILGGVGASNAVEQFLQSAAEENLKSFRETVEYGCRSGEREGESVSEQFDFKESIVSVSMVDSGSTYEAALDEGGTVTLSTEWCDTAYICDNAPPGEGCSAGSLTGGVVQLELVFKQTDGAGDPDEVYIAQVTDGGSGGEGTRQRCDDAGGFCTTGSECQNFGGSQIDASCDYSSHDYCCNVE